MKQTQVYEASDGRIFRYRAECEAYEAMLSDLKLLDSFLDQFSERPRRKTSVENIVRAWEAYKLEIAGEDDGDESAENEADA